MHYREIKYGFEYGAAVIQRTCSDERKGWVLFEVRTPKRTLSVYVTKTGKVRVYYDDVTRKELK